MSGLSYPFDSGPGATITEDQWSYLMKDAVGTGVHEVGTYPGPLDNQLQVFTLVEPGLLHVNPGRASINGFHYQQSGADVLTVTANPNVTQDRIDAAVLRLDLTTNGITLEAKLGSPSSSPVPPAISANELLLATFRVRSNSSSVVSGEVDDKRSFIGRRITVSDQGGTGRMGDIRYSPTLDSWSGVVEGGFTKSFAFTSDILDHTAAADPHPQYMTAAETNTTASTGTLSADPLMSTFASYHRCLNLPGGFKIVMFYYYGQFNGADQASAFTMFTMSDASMRPNFNLRYVGHQWKFSNSTDDIPLIVTVEASGAVKAGAETWLMGSAKVLVTGTYFKGTGV